MPKISSTFTQSDMDQSASEVDDNISPNLDRITKDQLYSAYRKIQAKYHKYRGRYTDLAMHYRELDKLKCRLESVLVETQDKVLRRITDLKEQCQLEQQAKAHLEEVLRNDIEEKDHIISTLNTKVKLLQASGSTLENAVRPEEALRTNEDSSKVHPIDPSGEPSSDESGILSTENALLKDKLKKLEALVLRYKDSLKRNKEKFTEVTREKITLENDYEALKDSTIERIGKLEDELSAARVEIENLMGQADILQRREEESAISLAENKLSVHRELEEKEEQIKQLQMDLKRLTVDKDNLNEAIVAYEAELAKLRSAHEVGSNAIADKSTVVAMRCDTSSLEMTSQIATQQMGTTEHRPEETGREARSLEGRDQDTLDELTRLRERETEVSREMQCKLDELEKRCTEYRNEKESFRAELAVYKNTCAELRSEHDAQKIIMEERRKDADATIEKLQATVQSVDKELENMRNALVDRDHVCENYNKKMQQYAIMLEKAKHKLTEQETQMRSLTDKLEEKTKLSGTYEKDLEIKRAELSALQTELEFCKSTADDLRNKIQADSSTISLLKKERSDLTNRLVHYNDCVRRLRQDCADIRNTVKKIFSSHEMKMSNLRASLVMSLAKFEQENVTLGSEVDRLRSKLTDMELTTSKETTKLRSELARMIKLKSTLETQLKKSDELDATNNKLIAEIDNLTFRIHDLGKAPRDLTQSQQEIRELKERLKALENLESANSALSREIDDLKEQHAQASRAFDQVNELNTKLREATSIISSLRSESSDRDTLREQLRSSTSEIARLKTSLTEMEGEIKLQNEKLTNEKEQYVAHLKSIRDNHARTVEEHARKYQDLEVQHQATKESHMKEIAGLMESNRVLQETVNVKLVQLKKMKIIKERQNKTIDETSAELNDLTKKHAQMSSALETCEKQIESLKLENAQLAKLTLENKDLKDKHNDLLSRNERLSENEEASKRKIEDHERAIKELRKIVRDHVESSQSWQAEVERLNKELVSNNEQLERKTAELDALKKSLLTYESELRQVKENLDEWNAELRKNSTHSTDTAARSNDCAHEAKKQDDEPLVTMLRKLLQEQIARMKGAEDQNARLQAELNDLIQQNSDTMATRSENDKLAAEQIVLRNRITELENTMSTSNTLNLQAHVTDLQTRLSSLEAENDGLRQSQMDTLRNVQNSSRELNALKSLLTEKEAAIKLLEDKNSSAPLALLEEKIADLQLRIDSLVRTNDALREELEVVRNDADTKCQLDGIDKLHEQNKRLEAQLDEALLTFQAKETQMQLMINELKAQANQLREQSRINEEEQGMRLKQLVKEFQAQLHDKEEELQAALEKRFGKVSVQIGIHF